MNRKVAIHGYFGSGADRTYTGIPVRVDDGSEDGYTCGFDEIMQF